jgi:large subunit ribosomal protein L5
MHFLEYYNENIVKYDSINKFRHKNLTKIPKLLFVSLRFKFKHYDLKQLIAALVALELLTSQKGSLLKSKVSSVTLKIRKGQPIGCKVTIRGQKMRLFLTKLISKATLKHVRTKEKIRLNHNIFSFKVSNVLVFNELEKNYQFFKNLKSLDVSFVTTLSSYENFIFLMRSYKIEA